MTFWGLQAAYYIFMRLVLRFLLTVGGIRKRGLYVCCHSRVYSCSVGDGGGSCGRDRSLRSRGYGCSDGSIYRRSVGPCRCAGRCRDWCDRRLRRQHCGCSRCGHDNGWGGKDFDELPAEDWYWVVGRITYRCIWGTSMAAWHPRWLGAISDIQCWWVVSSFGQNSLDDGTFLTRRRRHRGRVCKSCRSGNGAGRLWESCRRSSICQNYWRACFWQLDVSTSYLSWILLCVISFYLRVTVEVSVSVEVNVEAKVV